MRLLFVNRFYWPETPATGQLLTDLAESLAARGHEVVVVTSAAGAATPRHELRHGVSIHRVRGTRWNRVGVIGKAIDFATFYAGALRQTLRLASRGTLIVPMTDPPLLGIGVGLVARIRGARVLHWVQDIYPEIAMELAGQSWLRVLRPLRNAAWRRADRCVTVGEDMAALVARAGVSPERIAVIPNWALGGTESGAATPSEALRRAWQLEGRFVVAYSGNLGRVHDLEPVLAVAEAMRHEPSCVFLFIGDGAQRSALEADAARRALSNVRFVPAQPRERLAESLAVADVHLVTLRPGCEQFVFPSKLYGVAASGRPILFIGPRHSEVARLVTREALGLACERDATEPITRFLLRLMQDPAERVRHAAAARRFAAQHTSLRAAQQWDDLLAPVNACTTRPGPASTPAR